MAKEAKWLLGAIVLVLVFSIYTHWALLERLDRLEWRASSCNCPQSNAADLALAEISRTNASTPASHAYAEILLEGLVRHAGLPIDEARRVFDGQVGARKPIGWRWLEPWGGDAAAAPSCAAPTATTAGDPTTATDTATGELPPGWSWSEGYLRGPDSPDPLACTADADCVSAMLVDETGCCQPSIWPFPQAKAYHEWLARHLAGDACKAMVCPPGPLPSPPPPCQSEARCSVGTCVTACP